MEGNNLIKKGVVVAVIFLFIGLAFTPGINANQVKTDSKEIEVNFSYEDDIDRWALIIGI